MQNNDLISRKALIEDLMNLEVVGGHKMYRKGCDHTLHGLVPEMINAQPAVDAAPVVHSKWDTVFYERNRTIASYSHLCPECKYFYRDTKFKGHKYCPECGAKMDSGENS